MMKTEYAQNGGFLQRDSVEHEEYAEACSTESREVYRKDGADLLEKVLCRDNLNKAYKRVKANKGAYIRVHAKSKKKAKDKLRKLTSRSQGRKLDTVLNNIKVFMRGWLGYYAIAEMDTLMKQWNEWLRRRIRMYIWKQWKLPRTRVANLKKLGMPEWQAYRNGNTRKGYWAVAGSGILHHTITNKRLARRGYFDISEAYKSMHSI